MLLEDFAFNKDDSTPLIDKYTKVKFTRGEVRGIVYKEIMLKGEPEKFAERFEVIE